MTRQRYKRAQQLARALLIEVGATRPEHIDPIKSAQKKGIEIAFGGLSGATARICRNGSTAKIRVSDEIVQPGRVAFSIAHELGHHLLGHAVANERSAMSWERVACDNRPSHEEREADAFAVAHNTPADMVREHCVLAPVNWFVARAIAAKFPVSPVSSALRAVELSGGACAAVYAVDGRIAWAKPSPTFPIRLPRGKRLDRESVALALCEGRAVGEAPRTLLAETWLGAAACVAVGSTIVEHAERIPEPGWGGVLSLLWLPSASLASNHAGGARGELRDVRL